MNDMWLGITIGAAGVIVLAGIVWHLWKWGEMMRQHSSRCPLGKPPQLPPELRPMSAAQELSLYKSVFRNPYADGWNDAMLGRPYPPDNAGPTYRFGFMNAREPDARKGFITDWNIV